MPAVPRRRVQGGGGAVRRAALPRAVRHVRGVCAAAERGTRARGGGRHLLRGVPRQEEAGGREARTRGGHRHRQGGPRGGGEL